MMCRTRYWRLLPALVALALAGCFERDVQEVQLWMKQVESQARVAVPRLRRGVFVVASLATAAAVTHAGSIGFIEKLPVL